ncbi:hypothetical protein PV326_001758, partial [Microctonus aethiopoides]
AITSDGCTILQAAQALLQCSPQLKVDIGVVRITPEKFYQLIEILNVSLTKQNTKFRQSIGPYERLTVLLRKAGRCLSGRNIIKNWLQLRTCILRGVLRICESRRR